VLIGPGGVGKGTVARTLDQRDPRLWLSRSWTTRPRRPSEPEDAYVFTDRDAFMARVEVGGFLEWAEFLDNLYGTPVPEGPAGSDVLLEIDVQGARQVVEQFPSAVVILLVPPSEPELEARLRLRGDPESHVRRRVEVGRRELAEGRALASHVVVNDDLERAVSEVGAIIDAARRARSAVRDQE
jgi:guanylate kinase